MSQSSIQELLNQEAYILEDPTSGLFNIGRLSATPSKVGRFVDYAANERFYLSEPYYQLTNIELINALLQLESEPLRDKELNWQISSELDYIKSFKDAKYSFSNESLKKVILYKEATAQFSKALGIFFKVLKRLLESKSTGYIYGFIRPKNKEALVGLAPEYLFKTCGSGKLETIALAGTGSLDQDLLSDDKLIAEQKAVEIDISNSLGIDKVKWLKVREKVHGSLKHLSSTGLINDLKPEDLSLRLHPTSAVGLMPKNANISFSPGPEPRGFYGGYSELFTPSSAFSLVLIRGVEIKGNTLKMKFGGGVIQESVLESELKELELKFNNLRNLFGI